MKCQLLACVVTLVVSTVVECRAASPEEWFDENVNDLARLYVHFHAHPELSFEERETGNRVADEWSALGAEVTHEVGGFGVVGILRNGAGPIVMLRTDLDALPVTEQTGLDYASTVTVTTKDGVKSGVMHACGHDVHMTNLVSVARYLAAHRDNWSGTVMLVAQPAEELGAGARAMLDDGLFERFPNPDFAIALHVDSNLATGHVACRPGYANANVNSVDITLRGRGGHGAKPESTIDPIVMGAQLVLALQTIVSREVAPIDPAVITVGSIHGGTKHNIIGDECHLQLTVRSYSDDVRELLLTAIKRKANAIAAGAAAPAPIVEILEGTPSLYNNDELTGAMLDVFRRVLGDEYVGVSEQSMGGEDFSQYGRAGVPILMYRLGSVSERRLEQYKLAGQPPPSLHSAVYYPDVEDTLKTGIMTMAGAVLELLKPGTAR